MEAAYICDAIRTPIGRYGGALAAVRTDDLAAIPIAALMQRNRGVDWNALDDVILRLRESGRRRQPQRGAHGAAAGGIAKGSAGIDGEPACADRAWTRWRVPRGRSRAAKRIW